MTLIFDANAFLRLILNDIPSQADEVEEKLKKAKGKEIIINVPQIIIFEINFALEKYYQFSKENIIKQLELIINSSYLQIQDKELFQTCLAIFKQKSISLADCFLLAKAKQEDATIFTFDQKLKTLQKLPVS